MVALNYQHMRRWQLAHPFKYGARAGNHVEVDIVKNTLLVDADTQQLQLTYGASQYVHGRVDNVAAIIVRGDCEL